MKFTIKHEKKGRIRVHLFQKYMNYNQADTLQYYLENLSGVKKAQVFNRTCDALIYYTGDSGIIVDVDKGRVFVDKGTAEHTYRIDYFGHNDAAQLAAQIKKVLKI